MKIHIVKQGDTLYELSQKYDVPLQKLIEANPHISNPDQIGVGMKIKIPVKAVPVGEGVIYKHTVKKGDTLWKLAKAWGLPLQTLINANPQLSDPNALQIGEVVNIPGESSVGSISPNPNVGAGGNPSVGLGNAGSNVNANIAPLSTGGTFATNKKNTGQLPDNVAPENVKVEEITLDNVKPQATQFQKVKQETTKQENIDNTYIKPLAENIKPLSENVKPLAENIKPLSENVKPLAENIKPLSENVKPLTENIKPLSENIQPLQSTKPEQIKQENIKLQSLKVENIKIENYLPVTPQQKPIYEKSPCAPNLPYTELTSPYQFQVGSPPLLAVEQPVQPSPCAGGAVHPKEHHKAKDLFDAHHGPTKKVSSYYDYPPYWQNELHSGEYPGLSNAPHVSHYGSNVNVYEPYVQQGLQGYASNIPYHTAQAGYEPNAPWIAGVSGTENQPWGHGAYSPESQSIHPFYAPMNAPHQAVGYVQENGPVNVAGQGYENAPYSPANYSSGHHINANAPYGPTSIVKDNSPHPWGTDMSYPMSGWPNHGFAPSHSPCGCSGPKLPYSLSHAGVAPTIHENMPANVGTHTENANVNVQALNANIPWGHGPHAVQPAQSGFHPYGAPSASLGGFGAQDNENWFKGGRNEGVLQTDASTASAEPQADSLSLNTDPSANNSQESRLLDAKQKSGKKANISQVKSEKQIASAEKLKKASFSKKKQQGRRNPWINR